VKKKNNISAHLYFYPDTLGCTTSDALNYNPYATGDDGSCEYLGLDEFFRSQDYVLGFAYPNPFNPTTTIRYDLPENSHVNIMIYDIMGRVVRTLVNNRQSAGFKSVIWDATNELGQPVSAGMYLYKVQVGEFVQIRKMVLLK